MNESCAARVIRLMVIEQWRKIIDDDPMIDYKHNIKFGFVHYSAAVVQPDRFFDDSDILYSTYTNRKTSTASNKSRIKSNSYKKKIDHEQSKLKFFLFSLFHKYETSPERKNANMTIYATCEHFRERVGKIMAESGFSHRRRQKIITDIIGAVISQCKNAPKHWLDFGKGFKKNLNHT